MKEITSEYLQILNDYIKVGVKEGNVIDSEELSIVLDSFWTTEYDKLIEKINAEISKLIEKIPEIIVKDDILVDELSYELVDTLVESIYVYSKDNIEVVWKFKDLYEI